MQFSVSSENRSKLVQMRVTPTEEEWLKREAEAIGGKVADVLRKALDVYQAQLSAGGGKVSGKGSKDSGSKSVPSGLTAKVKAAGKRSPSNSKKD